MTYQVLARKWRPQTFSELVGQDHVLRALINALENERLHHAYLFTGTRGVGKTTIARILARSLNCETGITSNPCGACSACLEITEGRFVDLIEVDAASRTKVEDTRELLENVQYAPTKGRFKVYLIDEVHMLSNHSFNALLKTLEEPPPHVKFLLATTDPQRLPVTILSRCLQFHLKRLTIEQINRQLEMVLSKENIEYEPASTLLIARAADGSVRDSLSLLDQAIAFGAGALNEVDVRNMLGAIDHNDVNHLLTALSQNNADNLVAVIQSLAEHSPNFDQVLADLLTALHHLALFQMAPDALDSSMPNYADLKLLADNICPEDVQLYYQIGLIGRRDLPLAPDPKTGFEMVMLRMLAFKPEIDHNSTRNSATTNRVKLDTPITSNTAPAPSQTSTVPKSTPKQDENIQIATNSTQTVSSKTTVSELSDWEQLVEKLSLTGMAKQLALNCTLKEKNNERITLSINEAHQHLLSESRKKPIETALRDVLQTNISLTIELTKANLSETPAIKQQQRKQDRLDSAVSNIDSDHAVQQFKDVFDATVSSDSIEPID